MHIIDVCMLKLSNGSLPPKRKDDDMNVDDMNVTALRKLASELKIVGRSKMNADELREAINKVSEPEPTDNIELPYVDENSPYTDNSNYFTKQAKCDEHTDNSKIPVGRIRKAHLVPARRAKNKMARKTRQKARARAR